MQFSGKTLLTLFQCLEFGLVLLLLGHQLAALLFRSLGDLSPRLFLPLTQLIHIDPQFPMGGVEFENAIDLAGDVFLGRARPDQVRVLADELEVQHGWLGSVEGSRRD